MAITNDNIKGTNGSDSLGGGAGDDIVRGGNGDDTVRGGGGNDVVMGGFGNDYVKGGEGNDIVNGGQGNDTLAGGRDADIFVYDGTWGAASGNDVVLDYTDGEDKIQLMNTSVASMTQVGDDTVLTFTTGGSLTLKHVLASSLGADDFLPPGHTGFL